MVEQAHNSRQFDPFARDAAREPERLVREATTATLATFDRETGHPFATLVAVATASDGTPLLLLSDLARHTANLKADPRASLLFTSQIAAEDPLAAARLTVVGSVARTPEPRAVARYVARHPSAADYVSFGDFACYAMSIATAHLVAGFGRITGVPAAHLVGMTAEPEALALAEYDIVRHMNEDHVDALVAMARAAGARSCRAVHMTGIDPGGLDLMADGQGIRLFFAEPVLTPQAVRTTLVTLTTLTRSRTV